MKVKIGNDIYDSEFVPIMVVLSQQDKENIKNMAEDATKYCSFPEECDTKWIGEWMAKFPMVSAPVREEKINVRIAEECGFSDFKKDEVGNITATYMITDADDFIERQDIRVKICDFYNVLDMALKAENHIFASWDSYATYTKVLLEVCQKAGIDIAKAKSQQRCEAILRALGKWEGIV